jgi:hypothetical protein
MLSRILLLALAGVVSAPATAAEDKYAVVASHETVGTMIVKAESHTTAVEFQVRNNGRGPTLSEKIELDSKQLPTSWSIDGTTAFGGRVAERFTRTATEATWESQADRGSAATGERSLYIANDASPFSYELYARALLRAPGNSLDVLPSGRLHLDKLRELTFGKTRVTAYMLTGVNLTPDVVLLDRSGRLFARADAPEVLVRAGYEQHADELIALSREVSVARLEKLQRDAAHHYDKPLRITNVRIFDSRDEKLSAPSIVVVYRNRIASVRPYDATETAEDEIVIDGMGGTLIPGLHDMHSHNSPWTGIFYLAAGVTNVRDMGNDNDELLTLVDQWDRGRLPGPRVVRAGFLEGRSPYSARYGFIPETLPAAIEDVRWYADHGYRQIKIYNSMTPDWVQPIATEAHRLGLRVSGHVPAFMSPDRAINDGYDEINHLNQLVLGWLLTPEEDTRTPLRLTALGERSKTIDMASPRVRATLELMQQHHTALDPTLVIIERLMMSRAGTVSEQDAPYLDHMPIGYQRYRKRSFVDFKSPEHERTYAESFEQLQRVLKALHDAGVQLLPGTDDGTGFTVHRELELYVKAGIPAGRALSLATLRATQYLGQDQDLGTIEGGKLADFVLLEGDPVANISAIRRAKMVVKNAAIYFPAELYEAIGIAPFASAPHVQE